MGLVLTVLVVLSRSGMKNGNDGPIYFLIKFYNRITFFILLLMGGDVFYPDNPKREKRLKDLCEQIKSCESNVNRWDKEMSDLGLKIGERLKKLQSYCAEVCAAIESMGLGAALESPK